MPYIIGAILLIVVYYFFIKWMFVSAGPTLIYVLSTVASFLVPVCYFLALFKQYGRRKGSPGVWRNIWFGPIAILILLMHIDLLTMILNYSLGILSPGVGRSLLELCGQVSYGFVLNRWIMTFLNFVANHFMGGVFGIISSSLLWSAAMKVILIAPFALLAHGIKPTGTDPSQPAFVSYFHRQAIRDLGQVIVVTSKYSFKAISKTFTGILYAHMGPWALLIWPLGVMAVGALIPPIIIGVVVIAFVTIFHSLAFFLIWALAMSLSFLLYMTERAVMMVRIGYAKCPHANCHAPVPLPVFLCPECGAEHTRLVPGKFGVLFRHCSCGVGRLPTLFWLGKGKLMSVCPYCRNPMREELFAANVHLPIYGGASAGKTMFMLSSAYSMLEDKVPGINATLIEERAQEAYTDYWKPDYEAGRVQTKTTQVSPDAFLLSVKRGHGLPASVYMYDPAGEALMNENDLETHHFMKYFDGLALLIDPMSLDSFARRYRELGGPNLDATTSPANPDDIVSEVVNLLATFGKLSRKSSFGRRIAVVFTKADILGFKSEVGIQLSNGIPQGVPWDELGEADSNRIRAWLASNEPALLQVLETRFSEMRFFAASALGAMPGATSSFSPKGVMEPVAWLMSRRLIFRRPRLSRVLENLAEVGAGALVWGLFVGLPLLLLSILL